jgi:hypothetical protein
LTGISINPYALSVQVDGLAIQEKDGSERRRRDLTACMSTSSRVRFRGGPVISELKLVGPALKVVRLPDGRFNFSDLIDEWMAKPPSDDPDARFSRSTTSRSAAASSNSTISCLAKSTSSAMITIALPFVSSLPAATEIFVEPAFSASIDGSPLIVQGRSKPFAESMESELALDFRDLQLGKYLDYLPIRLPIQVGFRCPRQ